MAIEGPLKELGLYDVFQLLDLSRRTGVLHIVSQLRNNEGTVFFDGGAVVYAEIRANPHRLGELLLHAGKITEADLERARGIQEREGGRRRFGQVLVAIGAILTRDLGRLVEIQVEEVVFELMSWQEGFFSFREGPLHGMPVDLMVRIPVENLLMEGARRIDEWSRIERHIPHLGVVPSLVPLSAEAADRQLVLLPAEWQVLGEVDGERDVRQIAASLGRSEFDVAKTLFGLISTGVLVLRDPASARPPRVWTAGDDVHALTATAEVRLEAGDVAAAKAAAQAAVVGRPDEARAHLVLGRACLAEGTWSEAADECRHAVRLDPELADAYRWYGFALAATGRFREAHDTWERWEHRANASATDEARRTVAEAKAAAAVLARALGGSTG